MRVCGISFDFASYTEISIADWAPRNVHEMIGRVIAAIGSSVTSGPELSSKPEWNNLLVSYTNDVLQTAILLKPIPPYFRPMVSKIMPSVRRISKHRAIAYEMVIPVLKAKDPGYVKPNDIMQWIANKSIAGEYDCDFEHQAELQLSNGLATLLSSTVACTLALFDLASHTEYIEPLREEIENIIALNNGLTKEGLAKMDKLDSFF